MAIPYGMIALSGIVAAFTMGLVRMIRVRRFYKDVPCPPHSFFWGHLKLLSEAYASMPRDCHYHVPATTIAYKYNMPRIFYLDLWPVADGQIVVADPDVALHMTAVRNHPKHEAEKWFIDPLIGSGNIVTEEGPRWKQLHKMLSPAFAVMHITNMRPMVAREVMKFRHILHEKAKSGEKFTLETYTQRLTFDVIGTATFGSSLDAQTHGHPALQHFEDVCRAFMQTRESFNFVRNFFYNRKRFAATKRLNNSISGLIQKRFEVVQRENKDLSEKKGLGIMDLILRGYVKEHRECGRQDLDPDFLADAITQVKSLVVAGASTTSDTISFACMLLSTHPKIVQKMREEHDRVFTPGTEATYEMLCDEPYKLNQLGYTTNVIKEVLRFYPIGNTARQGLDTITYEGKEYPTKGHMMCPVQMVMHMNPEIFPNPKVFDPDRFERQDFPRHAWRPFERGPRGCLGQPLAMDELKIALLLVARDFDFICQDLKPAKTPRVSWLDLDLVYGDRAFQEFVFEARPRDGMPMIVRRSNWPS